MLILYSKVIGIGGGRLMKILQIWELCTRKSKYILYTVYSIIAKHVFSLQIFTSEVSRLILHLMSLCISVTLPMSLSQRPSAYVSQSKSLCLCL